MRTPPSAAAFLASVLALLLTGMAASPADPPATPAPARGHLPAGWKKLGLAPETVAAVEQVTGVAAARIHALEEEIRTIRAKEHADCLALLNDAQRKALADAATGASTPTPDKVTTPPTKP